MDNSLPDPIVLRSPFNGETIQMTRESCPPQMLDLLILAGFVHLNPEKHKTKKETREWHP